MGNNGTSKIIDISEYRTNPYPADDIIKPEDNNFGGKNMDNQYATKEELKTLEAKIDGKFDTLNATVQGGFARMDEKFNTQDAKIDSKLEKLKLSQIKWFIGTTIAIVGLVSTIILGVLPLIIK